MISKCENFPGCCYVVLRIKQWPKLHRVLAILSAIGLNRNGTEQHWLGTDAYYSNISFTGKIMAACRVATVREKYLENEIFSKSGKSQGI